MTDLDLTLNLDMNVTGRAFEYIGIFQDGYSASGKTGVFTVMSKRGAFLGQIAWHGAWRQYTFRPTVDSIFSVGCMDDIGCFIVHLHEQRKREAKAMIHEPVCGIPDCGCSGVGS